MHIQTLKALSRALHKKFELAAEMPPDIQSALAQLRSPKNSVAAPVQTDIMYFGEDALELHSRRQRS
jgi:hypothetical protein